MPPPLSGSMPASDWVPQTLPAGWTGAGLSEADAIQAERLATTFTDREMSLFFYSTGTRAQHAGSFTASFFLLSPGGRQRFLRNDVRVANNVLFDRVAKEHLVQLVIAATPRLVQFQAQGQQQFAWVDVRFGLWQSRRDPVTGQPTSGVQSDPTTHLPTTHHLAVLLVRVAPGTPNAPMGGVGWLVSTYALDAGNALPRVVQPA